MQIAKWIVGVEGPKVTCPHLPVGHWWPAGPLPRITGGSRSLSGAPSIRNPYQGKSLYEVIFFNSTLSFGRQGLMLLTNGNIHPGEEVRSYLQLKFIRTLGCVIQIGNLNVRIRIRSWVLGFEFECLDLECTEFDSNFGKGQQRKI